MRKVAVDVLLIILSGVISFYVSISHPQFNNMEMGAMLLVFISGGVSILTLLIYAIFPIYFVKFYQKNRWRIATIFCTINVITGIMVYFNDW